MEPNVSVGGTWSTVDVSRVGKPYPHVRFRRVFDAGLAARVVVWLGETGAWRHQAGSFYRHDSFALMPSVMPRCVRAMVSPVVLAGLRAILTSTLGTPLRSFAWVEAHRAAGEDHIGLHTDGQMNEARLMVNLSKGSPATGGVLTLQDKHCGPRNRVAYRPEHNSGTAFRTTSESYHRVSCAREGTRYTVLYRFPVVDEHGPRQFRRPLSLYATRAVITTFEAGEHRWSANPGLEV